MTKEEIKEIVSKKAWENHANGLNCSESVFKAVFDAISEEGLTDLPPEVVALSTCMGGGVGLSGNTCGALLGGILAAGVVHGRKNPFERETVDERRDQLSGPDGLYRLFNNMVHEFKENNGTAWCQELIKSYSYSSEERKVYCRKIIAQTASNTIEWIYKGIEHGYKLPFHYNIKGEKE